MERNSVSLLEPRFTCRRRSWHFSSPHKKAEIDRSAILNDANHRARSQIRPKRPDDNTAMHKRILQPASLHVDTWLWLHGIIRAREVLSSSGRWVGFASVPTESWDRLGSRTQCTKRNLMWRRDEICARHGARCCTHTLPWLSL